MRDSKRSKLLFAPFLLAIVAGGAAPVWAGQAAPERVASSPAPNEQRDEVPTEVSVTFSTPLDATSDLRVVTECGVRVDDGNIQVVASQIEVGIAPKHQELQDPTIGEYEVRYHAKSAGGVAGETRSAFSFNAPLVCKMDHKGHGNKGGGKGHGKGHGKGRGEKGHGKHGKGGKGDGEHDGSHDDDDGSHSSGSSDHDSGSAGHDASGTDHAAMDHKDKSGGKHKQHNNEGSPDLTIANGPRASGPSTPISADAQAAVIGLGLALLVGVMGGWFLRFGPR